MMNGTIGRERWQQVQGWNLEWAFMEVLSRDGRQEQPGWLRLEAQFAGSLLGRVKPQCMCRQRQRQRQRAA